MADANKIEEFWEWFQGIEARIRKLENAEQLTREINDHVLAFGLFAWDVGPGTIEPWLFTISPNGDRERLQLSRNIISAAPSIPNWEFEFCRPPAEWDFMLEMHDSNMDLHEVDASQWGFKLDLDPENRLDVTLFAPNLAPFHEDDQWIAGDKALTLLLGEEQKIERIASLEILANDSEEENPVRLDELKSALSEGRY